MVAPRDGSPGLIETMLVRGGVVHFLMEHIERLRRSATELKMPVPDVSHIAKAVEDAIGDGEHAIRIEWLPVERQWRMRTESFPIPPLTLDRRDGCRLVMLPREFRPEQPGWKTTARTTYERGLAYAADRGGNEGLVVDENDRALEGTVTNVFLVKREGLVLTAPADGSILPGVMRGQMLVRLRDAGVDVREERFPATHLREFPSFVTSSLTLIAPVTRFNGRAVPQSPLIAAIRLTNLLAD